MVRRFRFSALAMGAVMLALLYTGELTRAQDLAATSLIVDRFAVPSVDINGLPVITVTGTLTCTSPTPANRITATVTVTVVQVKSNNVGTAIAIPNLLCTGTPQIYTAAVKLVAGAAFKNGPATAIATAVTSAGITLATTVARIIIGIGERESDGCDSE